MEMEFRLDAFERMLAAIQADYDSTVAKMRALKGGRKGKDSYLPAAVGA